MSDIRYKRVLLKLSGEALMGDGQYGIDPKITDHLAKQVKELLAVGHEVGVVVGGGNIFRGMAGAAGGMERAQADYMGMLATVMNALALQDAFEHNDVPCRVMSAIQMNEICEPIFAVAPSTTFPRVMSLFLPPVRAIRTLRPTPPRLFVPARSVPRF
mgnify:CR=1 FL=1